MTKKKEVSITFDYFLCSSLKIKKCLRNLQKKLFSTDEEVKCFQIFDNILSSMDIEIFQDNVLSLFIFILVVIVVILIVTGIRV